MKIILLMLLIFTSGCLNSASDADRLREEDNIREAVFLYQFDHNASAQQKRAAVYCLSLGAQDNDPSNEFMKRFADHKPPVRKRSECEAHAWTGVIDKHTGKRGLIFRIKVITWISDTEAEVDGGYYEAGLSSSDNTYSVTKLYGTWKVTNDKMNWISQRVNPLPPAITKWPLLSLTT